MKKNKLFLTGLTMLFVCMNLHFSYVQAKSGPITVCYVETNSNSIESVGEYTLASTGENVFDIAIIFAGNINYDENQQKAVLGMNEGVVANLPRIGTLQSKGIKVLLSLLGNHQGVGVCNFADYNAAYDFAQQCKDVVDQYGLDGIDIDDEYAKYGTNGQPGANAYSFVYFVTALRELMPDKIITFYYIGEAASRQSYNGVTVGSKVNYSWNAYYGTYNAPNVPGLSNSQLGPAAVWINNTSTTTAANNAQRTINEGYGVYLTYALPDSDQSAYVSSFTNVLYGSSAVFGTPIPPTANNVAPDASISVSSEYPDAAYSKEKLTDGIRNQQGNGEWASNGETTPWAQLNWNQSVKTSKVILYDRPNTSDHVASGTLTFSDGSSVSVGSLPNEGAAQEVTFSERTITWVKFQVNSGDGPNNGLAEFEVVGEYTSTPPPSTTNIALNKPVTASSTYSAGYEASKAVDGDASSTRWASATNSNSQWIYVDLQNTYSISRVVLKWQDAYGEDFTIQVSNDASTWTTIKTVTNNTSLTNDFTGLSGTGRYVRMNGTAYGPYTLYSLWEFEVYGESDPGTPSNVALNKPATTSSIYGAGYEAAKAVDGDAGSTRWASAVGASQWIYVDLQDTYSISQVVLKWQAAYGKDFTIQVSDDASSWTTIKTVTNNSSLTNDLTGLSGTGRYVRMNGTAYGPYTLYSLWEFEVYGTSLKSAVNSAIKGEEANTLTEIKVYPNPATDVFTVESPEMSMTRLTIFDMQGRLVYQNEFEGRIQISTDEISGSGILFIKLASETNTYIQRIVIE